MDNILIIVIVAIVALAIGAAIAFVINNTLLKSRAEDIVKKAEDEAKVIFEKKNHAASFTMQYVSPFGVGILVFKSNILPAARLSSHKQKGFDHEFMKTYCWLSSSSTPINSFKKRVGFFNPHCFISASFCKPSNFL